MTSFFPMKVTPWKCQIRKKKKKFSSSRDELHIDGPAQSKNPSGGSLPVRPVSKRPVTNRSRRIKEVSRELLAKYREQDWMKKRARSLEVSANGDKSPPRKRAFLREPGDFSSFILPLPVACENTSDAPPSGLVPQLPRWRNRVTATSSFFSSFPFSPLLLLVSFVLPFLLALVKNRERNGNDLLELATWRLE